mmetsp:Transcript_33422/g.63796  ORF Transcript_33422/g.63796 Transcript_33422/m.63796 type:complete len:217 (+) Transcript_33422:147-797(+)
MPWGRCRGEGAAWYDREGVAYPEGGGGVEGAWRGVDCCARWERRTGECCIYDEPSYGAQVERERGAWSGTLVERGVEVGCRRWIFGDAECRQEHAVEQCERGQTKDCRLSIHYNHSEFGSVRSRRGRERIGTVRHSRIDRRRRSGYRAGLFVLEACPTMQSTAPRSGWHVGRPHWGFQRAQQRAGHVRRYAGEEGAGGGAEQVRRERGTGETGRAG